MHVDRAVVLGQGLVQFPSALLCVKADVGGQVQLGGTDFGCDPTCLRDDVAAAHHQAAAEVAQPRVEITEAFGQEGCSVRAHERAVEDGLVDHEQRNHAMCSGSGVQHRVVVHAQVPSEQSNRNLHLGGHLRPPGRLSFVVQMPGPWDGPVRVVHREPTCLRLATLRGHLEAGQVQFHAEPDGDELVFTIEAWARPSTRAVHLLYSHLRLAKEIQLNMWVRFCRAAAKRAGGRLIDGVHIRTHCLSSRPPHSATAEE